MIKSQSIQREVNQYDLNGVLLKTWNSIHEASKELSISNNNITKCCRGRQKTTGNFIWKYAYENVTQIDNIEEYIKNKQPIHKKKRDTKKVAQYTMDDVFVKVWDSVSDINTFFNKSQKATNVQACCRGVRNNAFGYKWRYVDDVDKSAS